MQLCWRETAHCCGCTLDLFEPETFPVACSEPPPHPRTATTTHNAPTRRTTNLTFRGACVGFPTQGAGAGQLRSLEEAVLLPLQDECQRRDGRPGPLRVSSVGQKGSASCAHTHTRIATPTVCLVFFGVGKRWSAEGLNPSIVVLAVRAAPRNALRHFEHKPLHSRWRC